MSYFEMNWLKLNSVRDERGCLTSIEGSQTTPFDIKRVFYMHDVSKGSDRGGHAHRDTDQMAVAVHGSVKVMVSNGFEFRTVVLDSPSWGILLPRLTWTRLTDFSEGAVCMVLASTHYDRSKSIRSWPEYVMECGGLQGSEPETSPILLRPEL
jgi:hypothetical protein